QVKRVDETTAPASAERMTASSQSAAPVPELVITPPGRFSGVGSRELWEYRELLYFLTKRELQIRYKQGYLGFAWAILQPAALTLISAISSGRIATLPPGGVPSPIFALAGLVPWFFVPGAVSGSTNSLVVDPNLLGKVYSPRLVIPVAKILALAVDLV